MDINRANNQLIYDNDFMIQQLKEQKRQRDYWMFKGYGENENKCQKNQTCKISKSDLVDIESDLFNLNRELTKTDKSEYKGGNPPTLKPQQAPYCNPLIYPPVENNIYKDLKPF